MSPRRLTADQSPAEPFTVEWENGERYTSDSRIWIRQYLNRVGGFEPQRAVRRDISVRAQRGWGTIGNEESNTVQALELLIEMREQLEHEIDTWIIYGLENGVALRQLAGQLALTRQGLSKRLATRRPDGYDSWRWERGL